MRTPKLGVIGGESRQCVMEYTLSKNCIVGEIQKSWGPIGKSTLFDYARVLVNNTDVKV